MFLCVWGEKIMYQLLSDISQLLSSPFISIINHTKQIPMLAAFILGLIGALAPCQLTGNMGAITIYGNRSLQLKKQWIEVIFFISGKIFVFSALGWAFWIAGEQLQPILPSYFSIFRKLMGPLFVIIGLFLLGLIQFRILARILDKIPTFKIRNGKFGSFLMGVGFSIAFCPTMFALFFFTLMPIVISTPYGAVLPSIFGIGTSIPIIILVILISYLGMNGLLMKKSRKIGSFVQKAAGMIIILIGILDTITYWA
jgi:cytochrome c-type biogenesis protein